MSLQWNAVASFLYLEMFLALLFILPFISASRWSKIFKSRFVIMISYHSTLYFNVFLILLGILFLDAIREVIKYNQIEHKLESSHHNHDDSVVLMRLFRSQRNLYISGFALFMWFILRRMVMWITRTAQLEAINEASLKQAKGASEAAKNILDKGDILNKPSKIETELKEKLQVATTQLESSEKEIERLELDLETLKKQYDSHNRAYDELLAEHDSIQAKLAMHEKKSDNKKDD